MKQTVRGNIEKYEKDLLNKMHNPYYFSDRALQVGFIINLDSHKINHSISTKTDEPKFPELRIDTRYIN